VNYHVRQKKNLDVTMRDDADLKTARLDFVRNSRGADRLTRPIDLARKWTFVTDVRLHKEHLVWKYAARIHAGDHWLLDGQVARQAIGGRQEAEQGGRGILDEFLHLCDADDEAILKYAQTWGVLELCRHNLPCCHEVSLGERLRLPAPMLVKPQTGRAGPADDPRQCPPLGREPLATWRFFSGQAKALLTIADDLHRIELAKREDWAKLLRDGVTPVQTPGAQRLCMRDVIEDWLKLGRIKPAIDDSTGGLTWTGADLFGELAVQVALAAKSRDGQAFCIVCGKAYEPKRRVIRRGFNYCPDAKCQKVAAAQRAKQYRNRKRMAVHGSGRKLPYRGPYQGRTNDPLFSQ
jgi:hypothetical protein